MGFNCYLMKYINTMITNINNTMWRATRVGPRAPISKVFSKKCLYGFVFFRSDFSKTLSRSFRNLAGRFLGPKA